MRLQILAACAVVMITGCANSWINNPSPSTRNLVNDLRLDGFTCKAAYSAIECIETEPTRKKMPAKCDSSKGCVEQPSKLIFNLYTISQGADGIPQIKQQIVEKTEGKLIGGTVIKDE